jgi:peroxiredoxin
MLTSLNKSLLFLLMSTSLHAAPMDDYADALRQYQERSAAGPDFSTNEQEIIKRAKAVLSASLPEPGIRVGEPAPDFTLPNAFGKPVHLYDELKKGPVVLVFYRGAWCPYCNLHLRMLRENLPQFHALGARLIAVSPQTPDKSIEQSKNAPIEFDVLSDFDSSVMRAYRLYFEVDADLAAVYRKYGLNLVEYNGAGRNVLPSPGAFVIGRGGIVTAMQASTDYTQRMEPAEIVRALEALNNNPPCH